MKKYNTIIFILVVSIIAVIAYIMFSDKISAVSIEEITLNQKEVSLYVGEKYKLMPTIIPENATDKNIKWKSNNVNVANVDNDGNIEAITEGETDIVVSTIDGTKSDSCHVSVKSREIERIEIEEKTISIRKDEEKEIHAVIYPYNATNSSLMYQSSDESIITVDTSGKITGVKDGTAEVIIKDSRGKVEERVKVIVGIPLENIEIDKKEISIYLGKEDTLKAIYTPENTTVKEVTWTSSNNGIVEIDQNGKITGKEIGEAIITLTSPDTGKSATCKVKVSREPILVQSVMIDKGSVQLEIGKTAQLTVTVNPSNADNKEVVWTSSDESIVSVSQNGLVTAKKNGRVTITVTSKEGNKTSTSEVIVKSNPIVPSTIIKKYEGSTLKYYVQKNNGYYLTYIWMEDPYNQIKKLESNVSVYGKVMTDDELTSVDKRQLVSLRGMINNYINKGIIPSNKTFVAFNASGFWTAGMNKPSNYYVNRSDSWLVITDGIVTRNRPNDAILSSFEPQIMGITSSGNLKVYPYTKNKTVDFAKNVYNSVISDGVKNTWSFYPELINNGTNIMWDDTKYAMRQAICQVDSNNYIMFINEYNKNWKRLDVANVLMKLGCKEAFNLDGGGSISIYYGNNNEYKCYNNSNNGCRNIVEGIYFIEK